MFDISFTKVIPADHPQTTRVDDLASAGKYCNETAPSEKRESQRSRIPPNKSDDGRNPA
jgi:hypothetical protein